MVGGGSGTQSSAPSCYYYCAGRLIRVLRNSNSLGFAGNFPGISPNILLPGRLPFTLGGAFFLAALSCAVSNEGVSFEDLLKPARHPRSALNMTAFAVVSFSPSAFY